MSYVNDGTGGKQKSGVLWKRWGVTALRAPCSAGTPGHVPAPSTCATGEGHAPLQVQPGPHRVQEDLVRARPRHAGVSGESTTIPR